ncbi:MAG: hypothetical protein ACO1SX_03120, partial [Actinomycetota bacterium]
MQQISQRPRSGRPAAPVGRSAALTDGVKNRLLTQLPKQAPPKIAVATPPSIQAPTTSRSGASPCEPPIPLIEIIAPDTQAPEIIPASPPTIAAAMTQPGLGRVEAAGCALTDLHCCGGCALECFIAVLRGTDR